MQRRVIESSVQDVQDIIIGIINKIVQEQPKQDQKDDQKPQIHQNEVAKLTFVRLRKYLSQLASDAVFESKGEQIRRELQINIVSWFKTFLVMFIEKGEDLVKTSKMSEEQTEAFLKVYAQWSQKEFVSMIQSAKLYAGLMPESVLEVEEKKAKKNFRLAAASLDLLKESLSNANQHLKEIEQKIENNKTITKNLHELIAAVVGDPLVSTQILGQKIAESKDRISIETMQAQILEEKSAKEKNPKKSNFIDMISAGLKDATTDNEKFKQEAAIISKALKIYLEFHPQKETAEVREILEKLSLLKKAFDEEVGMLFIWGLDKMDQICQAKQKLIENLKILERELQQSREIKLLPTEKNILTQKKHISSAIVSATIEKAQCEILSDAFSISPALTLNAIASKLPEIDTKNLNQKYQLLEKFYQKIDDVFFEDEHTLKPIWRVQSNSYVLENIIRPLCDHIELVHSDFMDDIDNEIFSIPEQSQEITAYEGFQVAVKELNKVISSSTDYDLIRKSIFVVLLQGQSYRNLLVNIFNHNPQGKYEPPMPFLRLKGQTRQSFEEEKKEIQTKQEIQRMDYAYHAWLTKLQQCCDRLSRKKHGESDPKLKVMNDIQKLFTENPIQHWRAFAAIVVARNFFPKSSNANSSSFFTDITSKFHKHPTRDLLDNMYQDLEKLFTPEKKEALEKDPIHREYQDLFNKYTAEGVIKEVKKQSLLSTPLLSPSLARNTSPQNEEKLEEKTQVEEKTEDVERKDSKLEKKDIYLPRLVSSNLLGQLQSDTQKYMQKLSDNSYPNGALGVRRYINKIIKEDEDGIQKLITLIDMTKQKEIVDQKNDPVSYQLQKNLPHLSTDQIRNVIRFEVMEHFLSCLDGYEDENCSDAELYVATCLVEYYFTIGLSDHIPEKDKKAYMQTEFTKIEKLTKPLMQIMRNNPFIPSFFDEKGNHIVVDGMNVIQYVDEIRRIEKVVNQLNERSLKDHKIVQADFKNASLFYHVGEKEPKQVRQVTDDASFLEYKEATKELRKKNKTIVLIGGLQDTLHLIRATKQLINLCDSPAVVKEKIPVRMTG